MSPFRRAVPLLVAVLLGSTGLAFTATASAQQIDSLSLEGHAWFLSHDLLEGRHPASQGEAIAATYLISRLRGMGIGPLPSTGYRMPVPLTAVHVEEDQAVLWLDRAGDIQSVRPPAFYHPGGGRGAFRDFGGPVLFAGAAPGARDALRGHDIAGAVIVVTPPWSGLTELQEDLRLRGAAGMISLIPDGDRYDRLRIVRGPVRYFLSDAVDDPANQARFPGLVGGPELAEALGIEDEAVPDNILERARPLDLGATLELPYTTAERTGRNVGGYVPGTDPDLRHRFVVYVAHYDHVGYGEPTAGDSIWNGFIDNAAGSSMLLEIARVMAEDPPARSVVFLWVTAEEQGLLGANWFVHDPPVNRGRIDAVLNLDGGAPPAPPVRWGVVGADASWAGATARRVVERRGWSVDAVGIGPQSDHWPFARADVPTTMLFPGPDYEGLSDREAEALRERWHHPHTPDDEWHPDFPFSGLVRYAELALEIGRALAEAPRATPPPDTSVEDVPSWKAHAVSEPGTPAR